MVLGRRTVRRVIVIEEDPGTAVPGGIAAVWPCRKFSIRASRKKRRKISATSSIP